MTDLEPSADLDAAVGALLRARDALARAATEHAPDRGALARAAANADDALGRFPALATRLYRPGRPAAGSSVRSRRSVVRPGFVR